MQSSTLSMLARMYQTPCYVFDTGAFQKRIRDLRAILPESIRLCYSIKANPFLIPAALKELDCLEVCSPGELSICEELHVDPERIVYSGVCKGKEDIREAIRYHAGIFTAESIRQFTLLEEGAGEADTKIPVLLRLCADSQFGMSEEDLEHLVAERGSFPHLVIEGIHYFVGTQRRNKELKKQKDELKMLRELVLRLRETYGIPLRKLEYGPGLPVPLFAGEDASDTLAPAKVLAEYLAEAASWADVTMEMGRFLATECGYYLTSVVDTKTNGGRNYCLTDGGINHVTYLGQIMGMKVPVFRHLKQGGREGGEGGPKEWAVCGSLCTTNDDLIRSAALSDPEPGDHLVFENIGAYSVTEGIYLFLSRTMPRIVLYNNDSDIQPARGHIETSPLNTIGGYSTGTDN